MNEIVKIANLLKIPVEKIITFPQYVEIISANQNVGSIPYITVANINTYDTSDGVLGQFRWNHVYTENMEDINKLVYDLLEKEEDEIKITIGGYRNLYAKDNKGNLICGITCSHINNEWTISKIE